MRKVYLSFLGLGTDGKYRQAVYELDGRKSGDTEFVQAAEMELLGAATFDKVVIVVTRKSKETHFDQLSRQLLELGVKERNLTHLEISEDMSPAGQWKWFEEILRIIEPGDTLTVDLTHGYRVIPIVFSTAIHFLQKARGVKLDAVYYGAFEKDRQISPIVDMKDFYIVNEWAEAVSRLVEDADSRKMVRVAADAPGFQVSELQDKRVIHALQDLTEAIRNVDVNSVSEKASRALMLIEQKREKSTETGKILFQLVVDKFAALVRDEPQSGRYDAPYFLVQLEIIRILLEHRFFMQAYTVMREFVASLGMLHMGSFQVTSNQGRKKRQQYAEVFINMLQYPEEDWRFDERGQGKQMEEHLPFYNRMKQLGVERVLRSFVKDLADYRNGFDHAWTCKAGAFDDIDRRGKGFLASLQETIGILREGGIL